MTLRTSRKFPCTSSARASWLPSRISLSSWRMRSLDSTGSWDVLTPQISTLFNSTPLPQAVSVTTVWPPQIGLILSGLTGEELSGRVGSKMNGSRAPPRRPGGMGRAGGSHGGLRRHAPPAGLPQLSHGLPLAVGHRQGRKDAFESPAPRPRLRYWHGLDRKSTRLNSSHVKISYADLCS